jgi:hypothetical protein
MSERFLSSLFGSLLLIHFVRSTVAKEKTVVIQNNLVNGMQLRKSSR